MAYDNIYICGLLCVILMRNVRRSLKLKKILRSLSDSDSKPCFAPERYGTYIIFGGLRGDGSRHVILKNYFGSFGSAYDFALIQPEFYAHHLDVRRPINDNPIDSVNGFVQDIEVHRVCMYTDGMRECVKPSIPLNHVGFLKIIGGLDDALHHRSVLEDRFEGSVRDAVAIAIRDPRFYAHHNDPCDYMFCDHPGSFQNGLVELFNVVA